MFLGILAEPALVQPVLPRTTIVILSVHGNIFTLLEAIVLLDIIEASEEHRNHGSPAIY